MICDFYNANPSSMSAALNNLSVITANYKIAILGDMFELGPESAKQHELIAKQVSESGIDEVILIGKDFYAFENEIKATFFQTPAEAAKYLNEKQIKDSLVLLKGSRGMKLENLLQFL